MSILTDNAAGVNPASPDIAPASHIAGRDYTCKHLPCSYPMCQEPSWGTEDRKEWGKHLASLRVSAGLSRAVLSRLTGIPDSRLKNWEIGWGHPGKRNAVKLAAALAIDAAALSREAFAEKPYHCFCLASENGGAA